jgi:hypothetical protein
MRNVPDGLGFGFDDKPVSKRIRGFHWTYSLMFPRYRR